MQKTNRQYMIREKAQYIYFLCVRPMQWLTGTRCLFHKRERILATMAMLWSGPPIPGPRRLVNRMAKFTQIAVTNTEKCILNSFYPHTFSILPSPAHPSGAAPQQYDYNFLCLPLVKHMQSSWHGWMFASSRASLTSPRMWLR